MVSAFVDPEGLFTQKNPRTTPKKSPKNPKKSKDFFEDLKIRIPYVGVNNSSNSVFKSFFIYKFLVHEKKFRKIQKIPKKSKDFFNDLKSVHLIWERTTPRIQCLIFNS